MSLITPVQAFSSLRIRTAEEAADHIFEAICNYIVALISNGDHSHYMRVLETDSEADPDTYILHVTAITLTKFRFSIKEQWIPEIQERMDNLVRGHGWTSIYIPFSKIGPDESETAKGRGDYSYYAFGSFRLNSAIKEN